MAAQLTARNRPDSAETTCTVLAVNSFPVSVQPKIRTENADRGVERIDPFSPAISGLSETKEFTDQVSDRHNASWHFRTPCLLVQLPCVTV